MKDKLPKPTKEQMDQTQKMLLDKYDVVIPKTDLVKIVSLIKELNWWLERKRDPNMPIKITEKAAIEFKDLLKEVRGIDIPVAEAYDEARSLLVITEYKEKERISREIRAIIVTHRPISRDQIVEEKTAKLFKLHFGVDLSASQIWQVVQYLTRIVWFEIGLDESLEKCLDDLLVYADKRKRGKKVNSLKLHNELRKAADEAIGKLNVISGEWERLYCEES